MNDTGVFSLGHKEIARLKWFEGFMRRRVELEQQTISGLQRLLKGAPPPLDSNLLWQRALEELLGGTRDELHTRIEELERLKDQMQAVAMSIAKADIYIRDLNSELENLKSTESVDTDHNTTVILHQDWVDIKSIDISVQKGRANLFSSGRAQKQKLQEDKAHEAFEKYYKQDLTYRRMVHQQRKSQEKFINSIPDRVQEYGTEYWTAVCDVGKVMESFADYLRNISSTCNSSGSAIWASAKSIKPLVDANCHTEAIEFAHHQSPIRFSPIHYRNPGSESLSPSGQTILFGCPLELRIVGEMTKIPPVLEYLLDSVRVWPGDCFRHPHPQQSYNAYSRPAIEKIWPLANKLEQAWSGVEETDRAIISKLALQDIHRFLIMGYFMALPKPVWSDDDIDLAFKAIHGPFYMIQDVWTAWKKDPTKIAVVRALISCQVRIAPGLYGREFGVDMGRVLAQNLATRSLHSIFEALSQHPDRSISPVSIIPEEAF